MTVMIDGKLFNGTPYECKEIVDLYNKGKKPTSGDLIKHPGTDDFEGKYERKCVGCGKVFFHDNKRRVLCEECKRK